MWRDRQESIWAPAHPSLKNRRRVTLTFVAWMKKVNEAVGLKTDGVLDYQDLPDWRYREAFDEGMSPLEAAIEVLEEAGFVS